MFISLLTEEIRADILALEKESEGLLGEIVGGELSREDAKARRGGLVDECGRSLFRRGGYGFPPSSGSRAGDYSNWS
ncbi:MAG: hypothetical protein U9N48_05550, partial [Euryarchaeota archaeon]|nr:hypothetical protein [Euryarchaeota archaeon]